MTNEAQLKSVYICVNRRFGSDTPSCAMRGSEKMMALVKEEMERRGHSYPIEKIMCLGQCSHGPAMRIAPGGDFFLGATKDKVSEIANWIEEQMKD
jgi:NADH:ubiquinone oxidoreductase subunit E